MLNAGAPVGRLEAAAGGPLQAEPAGGTPQELGRSQLGRAQGEGAGGVKSHSSLLS